MEGYYGRLLWKVIMEGYRVRFLEVNGIRKTIMKVYQRLSLNAAEIYTIKHNIKTWRSWNPRDATAEVLCDYMSIGEATIAFSYFANILARRLNAKIVPFTQRYRNFHIST